MILIDVNLLLYAYNADAPQHAAAKRWIEEIFGGDEIVALPWMTLWGFVRLSTNPRVWPSPMKAEDAFEIVRSWLAQPGVTVVEPGPRHFDLLQRMVIECQAAGRMVSDAVLAALALEHGATLATSDHDFKRFSDVRLINPLAPKGETRA